jgi:hypothetical protein
LDSATSVTPFAYSGDNMVYAALPCKGAETFWPQFYTFPNIFASLIDIRIMIL